MGPALQTIASAKLRRDAGDCADEVVRVALDRAESGFRPRQRNDQHRLALVIEGGGMGGAVSAGMCLLLEAIEVIQSFDMIVACSAGALNGAWTAAGQAAQGATNYEDLACREFVNPWRLAIGRPPINFALLFDGIARERKPIVEEAFHRGPEFHCLATSLTRGELRVFSSFDDVDTLLRAVQASCTLPVLGGDPVVIDADQFADGGLIESMPFETAFRLGATHILVLRSRWAAYRKKPYGALSIALSRRAHPRLGELVRKRPALYNREAEELEQAMAPGGRQDLSMITLPDAVGAVEQLERDPVKIRQGIAAGARAAAKVFCRGPIDLHWQPQVYSTEVAGAQRDST